MENIIQNSDQEQFANGQSRRDLRVDSDANEPESQLDVANADVANAMERCPSVASEEFPAPIGKLLGLMITDSGTGRATVEFEASERYANPMGTLHGGVLCDLADAAMGVAYRSILAEGETFTTIELKINFLRPVWKAKLRAEARVIRAGKVVGLIECNLFDERQRLVARASSTCMTLRGRLAEGRQESQLPSKQVDADERLAGYVREPHLPRFESRRAMKLSQTNAEAVH
jgi:uncharacterized protein (TIGR00369 family)